MSSINQLVSEIAHSVQQSDSVPVRRAIRQSIIHTRNDLIRQSYAKNGYVDKGLQQRFKLTLVPVPDGDTVASKALPVDYIKRTKLKVPRPTRLNNNLPFLSIRTAGVSNPIMIPYAKESSSNYYKHVPGMCPTATYDYINEYIYINTINSPRLNSLPSIVVESVFEQPQLITTETHEGVASADDIDDDDEFLIPEDMVNQLKSIVLNVFNPQVVRQTNEIPTPNIVK